MGSPYPGGPIEVPAEAWLDVSSSATSHMVVEDAVDMRYYDSVLGLISVAPGSSLDRLAAYGVRGAL